MDASDSPLRLEFESLLPGASVERVWAHATSWDGVDEELAPVRMSHPERFPDLAAIPADGRCHLVSTLSLYGIPFDKHRLALRGFEAPTRFDECSSNRFLRRWTHERTLEAVEGGTRVRDRLGLVPRIPGTGALLRAIYAATFRRRHARLRARFANAGDR